MWNKQFKVWDLFNWGEKWVYPIKVEKLDGGITKYTFETKEEAEQYSKTFKWYNISPIIWRFLIIKPIDEKINKNNI